MGRLAKGNVMLAKRADPSLGEARAFWKITENFGLDSEPTKSPKSGYKYQASFEKKKHGRLLERPRLETITNPGQKE